MDFGKVPENELGNIDFALPKDPKVTTEVLKKGKGNTKFRPRRVSRMGTRWNGNILNTIIAQ